MVTLTKKQKKQVKTLSPAFDEMKQIFFSVKHTGEMPKGKGHKYANYYNQGLIKMHTKKTERGGTIYGNIYLTKKAKSFLALLGV